MFRSPLFIKCLLRPGHTRRQLGDKSQRQVSGTGHKVQGGGGVVLGYENFFFKYWFSVAHPELFDKIGVAHPWSGTEKTSDPPPNQNQ